MGKGLMMRWWFLNWIDLNLTVHGFRLLYLPIKLEVSRPTLVVEDSSMYTFCVRIMTTTYDQQKTCQSSKSGHGILVKTCEPTEGKDAMEVMKVSCPRQFQNISEAYAKHPRNLKCF